MMDRQVRERARAEISRILESASFDMAPMDPPLDLSAVRGDECVLVLCSDDERETMGRRFNAAKARLSMKLKAA